MRPGALVQLRTLGGEAVRDALRRRIVAAVAVLSLLSLMVVESCTSCGSGGSFTMNGEQVDLAAFLSFSGLALYSVLALWTLVLAGLLAADHLSEPIADGSARLTLARPVGRDTFALARLLGSLAISLGAGAVLLGGATFFLVARYGLSPAPALHAGVLCALGAVCVAGLSMAGSLHLPRIVLFPLAFVFVWVTAGINLATVAGAELSGVSGAIERFGPPFGTALAVALAPWSGREAPAEALELVARLALWAVLATAVLLVTFRREEL